MSNELLNAVSEKLNEVTKHSMQQRKKQRQMIEQQYNLVETILIDRKNREEEEIDIFSKKIQVISIQLEDSFRSMSIQTHKHEQIINSTKEQFQNRVQTVQAEHQERMEMFLDKAQEEASVMKENIDKKSKILKEKIQGSLASTSKKLIALQKQLREQTQLRKQAGLRTKQKFNEELILVKQAILRQQDRRISTQRKMYAMIEQIDLKLNKQVDDLTVKRKKNNEAILKLIQMACQKMQEKQAQ